MLSFLRRMVGILGAVAAIGAGAAVISFPLWLLATTRRVVYNYLCLAFLVAGAGFALKAKLQTQARKKPKTHPEESEG